MGQHLVAQPAGPDSRGPPAADLGLQRPPRLGGLLVDLVQARQHGLQVPARGQHQLGSVGSGPDLVKVLGQVRDEGRVRRIAGLAAGVRRGVLVVRGVAVVRVAARRGLVVLLGRDGVLVVVFSGVVARPGLRRLRMGRSGGVGLGGVAVLWRGVAGLASAVLSGTAGRLVFDGTVRAAGGVLTGLAGLRACCRAGGGRRGLGEGPGVRDAGLGALDAGGGAGLLHREQGGAGGGLAGPGGVGDDGDGAAGVGRQRGVNGRCRAVGGGCGTGCRGGVRGGVRGAGGGVGAGVRACHFVAPFHFRRHSVLPASGYFWTTIALHRI